MNSIICTLCPKSCEIFVHADGLSGYACPRGEAFAAEELASPKRLLTSTVALDNARIKRLPVKTSVPVDKDMLFPIMEQLNTVTALPPVDCGQVIIANVLDTGADIVATRSIKD